MVNSLLGAREPALKLPIIFSEIVEKAGEPRGFSNAEASTEPLGAISRIVQMLAE
jgi:hypothetical protein